MKDKIFRLLVIFSMAVFTICVIAIFSACYDTRPEETWEEYVERKSRGSEAFGDFLYKNAMYPEIIRYTGAGGEVIIPSEINGRPVVEIEKFAFRETKLTGTVIIPDSVNRIWSGAFYGNELTRVDIPKSIRSIRAGAFQKNRLTSVVLPESVRTVEHVAFKDNPLTSITIGANVELGFNGIKAFVGGFDKVYYAGGQQAGTYTRPDTTSKVWTKQ